MAESIPPEHLTWPDSELLPLADHATRFLFFLTVFRLHQAQNTIFCDIQFEDPFPLYPDSLR